VYQAGFPPDSCTVPKDKSNVDVTGAPDFRPVPNRWIITRRLHFDENTNHDMFDPPDANIPEWESWIVESDCVRNLNDIGADVDIEVDVSPFINISPEDLNNSNTSHMIEGQAETFIGLKLPLFDYDNIDTGAAPYSHLGKLTVMSSSNPLFPDYTQHNMNVFTLLDSMSRSSAYWEK
jgi:hypothetical protein